MDLSTKGSVIYIYSHHDISTKFTALTRIMFAWILFSGNIQSTVSNSNSCFTWTNQGTFLRLVCRLSNANKAVAIMDPKGKYRAYCNIHTNGLKCISPFAKESVEFETKLKQIVMTIPLAQNRYDGKWTCEQGNSSYTTTVNMTEGIISSTYVRLTGQVHTNNDYLFTSLTCASCREPYGNTADFQLNGRTVAQIRYDRTTKTCVQRNELCNGTTCSCSPHGTAFFLRMVGSNGSSYSCLMHFEDIERGIKFQQTTTLVLIGQEFHEGDTKIVIMNAATTNNYRTTIALPTTMTRHNEASDVFHDYLGVWIACLLLVLLAILVFVLAKIVLHMKVKQEKIDTSKYTKSSERDESKSMLRETEQLNEQSEMMNSGGNDNLSTVTVHDSETQKFELVPLLVRNDESLPKQHKENQLSGNEVINPRGNSNITAVIVHDNEKQTFESVPLLDIPEEVHLYQKRWILFGISLLKLYKNFRTDIERLFDTKFNLFKEKHKVHVQIYPEYIKTVQASSKVRWQLNYDVINENKIRFGSDVEKYDYKIKSPLELSKMVLPVRYTTYSAFDDTMSFDTILQCFDMFSLYHTTDDRFRSLAKEIFQSTWIRWCDPRPTDWDEHHSKKNISLLVEMSKTCFSSNPDQMTEQEINEISENGLTLLGDVANFEDHEFLERIVGYITELIQFLEISHPEFSSKRMSKIKSKISEWESSLKEAMDASCTKMVSSKYKCQSCKKQNKNENAVCWCIDCEVHYCRKCKDAHSSMKPLENHSLIEINLFLELLPVNRKCTKHSANDVEYVCSRHDQLCCQECLIQSNEHRECEGIHPISNVKTKSLELYNVYSKQLNELHCILQNLRTLNNNVTKLDSGNWSFEDVLELVRSYCVAKNDNFEDHRNTLMAEMKEVTQEILIEFNTINLGDEVDGMFKTVEQESRQFDIIKGTNSGKVLYLFIHSSIAKLDEIDIRVGNISNHFSERYNRGNCTDVNKLCMQSIEWLLNSYKKTREQSVKKRPMYLHADNLFDIKWGQNYDKTNKIVLGMTTTHENHVLLSIDNSKHVFIIDENGDNKGCIETLEAPYDIAYAFDKTINEPYCVTTCATENALQYIDLFHERQKDTIEVTETASCGLTISPENIIVGSRQKIKIFTLKGIELRIVEINDSKGYITNITISSHGDLILTDDNPNSSRVHCVKTNGNLLFSYESPDLKSPSKTAMGRRGYILVLGYESHNIFIISSKGKTIGSILQGEVKEPVAICFNKECSKLYVADIHGKRLRCFDISFCN